MSKPALFIIVPMFFWGSLSTYFDKPEKPPEEPGALCAMMYGKVMSLHQAGRRAREGGEERFSLNNYYKAILVLKNIQAVNPDWNSESIKGKIEYYERLIKQLEVNVEEKERNYKKSLAALQSNLEKEPNSPRPHIDMADFYFSYGKVKDAERAFSRAIMLGSHNAETKIKLGNTYEVQGKYGNAEREYQKAVRLDSQSAAAHLNLGWLYLSMKKYADAEEEMRKAVALDSEYIDALIGLGTVYKRESKFKLALASFKKALEIEPENPIVNYNIGSTYCSLLNYINAENYMRKAADLAGRDTPMGKGILDQVGQIRRFNLVGQEGRGYRDRKRMLIYKGRSVNGLGFRLWKNRRERWGKEYKKRFL